MNRFSLALIVAAATLAANAQTATKPSTLATTAPKSTAAASTTSTATAPKSASTTSAASTTASTTPPWIKLPTGIPAVTHGPVKTTPIVVHYEDVKIGTGEVGEANKMWHLKYTGYRAADGVKFDTWEDHKRPKMDKDNKPVLGPDKKPVMDDPQPLEIPQGIGAVIPGFDFGLSGMKIGGKRRIFIPWQLAYGTRNIPDRPDHPGIPAKSDLIFDVELVAVTDMPARPAMPPVQPHPGMPPHPGAGAPPNGAPGATAPGQPAAKPGTPAPGSPATPAPGQPSTPAAAAAPGQPATPAPAAAPAKPVAPTTPPPSTPPAQPQSNQPQSK